MRKILLLITAFISNVSFGETFIDYATVISKNPVYEVVSIPNRTCWNEQVRSGNKSSINYGGAIIGTIAGGIIGNQIGNGKGKIVASAVGAATGAMIGNSIGNQLNSQSNIQNIEHCNVFEKSERRIIGYDIVYQYYNRKFHEFLPYEPSDNVMIKVRIELTR